MRIRSRSVICGLSASALVATLLPGCGATGSTGATASSRAATTMTSAPAVAVAPTTTRLRTEKWVDLNVGECLADLPPTDPGIVTVTVVDCTVLHQAEVYLRMPIQVNTALADVADRQCAAGFSAYTGRPVQGSPFAVTYLIDSDQNRTSSNPDPSTVICLLRAANGEPLTQSARR
jgi:hypothetical protein